MLRLSSKTRIHIFGNLPVVVTPGTEMVGLSQVNRSTKKNPLRVNSLSGFFVFDIITYIIELIKSVHWAYRLAPRCYKLELSRPCDRRSAKAGLAIKMR